LCLLLFVVLFDMQMATMPPVPAHRLAWRGTPWVLDIQRDGDRRLHMHDFHNKFSQHQVPELIVSAAVCCAV
jgi:hypothetical protein